MAGLIHFPRSSRRIPRVTRRSMVLGAAGVAVASTLSPLALAQDAAPEGTPGDSISPVMGLFKGEARQRLTALLERVPPELPGGPDPNTWLFSWLDLKSHLIALGNPDPYAESTNTVALFSPLLSNDPLFRYAVDGTARDVFGFSVLDADQIVTVGGLPDQVTFYAGGLPVATLPSVWEAAGYERIEGVAGEYWSAGANGEADPNSPIGQIGMGLMNNVAILDSDIVIFARTAKQLQAVQNHITNGDESAADNENLAKLIATIPEDAINVVALQGAGLEARTITPENPGGPLDKTTQDLLAESDDAVGAMPEVTMALFGITAGTFGADDADVATPMPEEGSGGRFFVDLLTGSEDEATAATEVVAWRVEHMMSPVARYAYRDLFRIEGSVQDNVARLTFSNMTRGDTWAQLLMIQDLWPFVWLGEA